MTLYSSDQISRIGGFFDVLQTTGRTQIAVMNLDDGQTSGEYGTDHPQADQILFVLEGQGVVRCEGEEKTVNAGDLVLIPAGAKHQVVGGPMRSLNVYGPVAYPDEA